MQQLPNNCRAGKFSVFPSNWKTVKASLKLPWRISYWFFDDNLKQKKKVVIKGMNHLETASERCEATKMLIQNELFLIREQGFNYFTKRYSVKKENEDISEFTSFENAIEYAYKLVTAEHETKIDMKSMLTYYLKAIRSLGYNIFPIRDITKKHIKLSLNECGRIKEETKIPIGKTGKWRFGIWNDNQHNHYRKYLSILFNELSELEVIEYNPVKEIKKRMTVSKIRETLTQDQRKTINGYLLAYHYSFWRFLQIFFHGGTRITELLLVKGKDVDLRNQRFKITIKKGKSRREVWRTIKDVAVPYWSELCKECIPDNFLFSVGLKPGKTSIRREQITRRWKTHIKDKFKVIADFYSLKHSNLDEIAELMGIREAQAAAGHTTSAMTMVYATGEKERIHNRLKSINNTF